MAGKKPTPVKPVPPSAQRTGSAASSPKQTTKASAAGAKARSPAKAPKVSKEKPAAAKKKRDKAEPEAGAKRKKPQASGEVGAPKKKPGKKGGEPEIKPQKEATSTKKQQSSGKSENPAPTPTKKQKATSRSENRAPTPTKKQQESVKSPKSAKKQQSSGKGEKPASAATTPTKKQQKEAKREKQQAPGGKGKSTPTKRKRDDAEPQNEVRSPKRASSEGEAGTPTPVKKKRKDNKAAVPDMGTCSFPMARVRQLMRAEDDTIHASNDAVFLINKASELFLAKFAENAYRNALKDRKKSIIYDNLSTTVCNQKGFKFLSDFIPQRLRAEDALKAAAGANSNKMTATASAIRPIRGHHSAVVSRYLF